MATAVLFLFLVDEKLRVNCLGKNAISSADASSKEIFCASTDYFYSIN